MLLLGIGKDEVKLVPHHKEWANLFKEEKKLLHSIIGEQTLGIEHFGSTAIKDIHAKPVIDIVVGVRTLGDVDRFDKKRLIIEADYYHLPRVQIDGKVVFAKFSDVKNLIRTHYLHIVEYEGDWWNKHLLFRDRLNADLTLRKEYETLKLTIAEEHSDDAKAYTDAKEAFIEKVLKGD